MQAHSILMRKRGRRSPRDVPLCKCKARVNFPLSPSYPSLPQHTLLQTSMSSEDTRLLTAGGPTSSDFAPHPDTHHQETRLERIANNKRFKAFLQILAVILVIAAILLLAKKLSSFVDFLAEFCLKYPVWGAIVYVLWFTVGKKCTVARGLETSHCPPSFPSRTLAQRLHWHLIISSSSYNERIVSHRPPQGSPASCPACSCALRGGPSSASGPALCSPFSDS